MLQLRVCLDFAPCRSARTSRVGERGVPAAADVTAVTLGGEESELEATFHPGAGMLCSSLRHRGDELLAQNAGVAAYAQRGATMGIPLLYPWANRLAGFSYTAAGRTVEVPHDPTRIAVDQNGLPIHGVIGGRLRWELTSTPGPGARSLTASLSWSESAPELFEVFPYSHELRYEARLGSARLEVEVGVHASGADSVPLAFGFHPYLSLPGLPRERWEIELPAMRHLALDANQIPVGPEQALAAEQFELAGREFDDGFDSVAERARFGVAAGRRIEVEFLEGFPCAQVFAPRNRQFICFEPMTAPANALRSGMGLRVLGAGGRYRARFSVQVLPGSEVRNSPRSEG
jgi:aldose 1-epimerase